MKLCIVQGELLPWLPVSQSQPKDRPEMVKALQVLIQNHKQMQSQLTTDGQGPIEDMVGALIFVVQVAEKTEAFMENSRKLANTAARLEQNKEEVAKQVSTPLTCICVTLYAKVEGVVSLLPALAPVPTSQTLQNLNLTSACL